MEIQSPHLNSTVPLQIVDTAIGGMTVLGMAGGLLYRGRDFLEKHTLTRSLASLSTSRLFVKAAQVSAVGIIWEAAKVLHRLTSDHYFSDPLHDRGRDLMLLGSTVLAGAAIFLGKQSAIALTKGLIIPRTLPFAQAVVVASDVALTLFEGLYEGYRVYQGKKAASGWEIGMNLAIGLIFGLDRSSQSQFKNGLGRVQGFFEVPVVRIAHDGPGVFGMPVCWSQGGGGEGRNAVLPKLIEGTMRRALKRESPSRCIRGFEDLAKAVLKDRRVRRHTPSHATFSTEAPNWLRTLCREHVGEREWAGVIRICNEVITQGRVRTQVSRSLKRQRPLAKTRSPRFPYPPPKDFEEAILRVDPEGTLNQSALAAALVQDPLVQAKFPPGFTPSPENWLRSFRKVNEKKREWKTVIGLLEAATKRRKGQKGMTRRFGYPAPDVFEQLIHELDPDQKLSLSGLARLLVTRSEVRAHFPEGSLPENSNQWLYDLRGRYAQDPAWQGVTQLLDRAAERGQRGGMLGRAALALVPRRK